VPSLPHTGSTCPTGPSVYITCRDNSGRTRIDDQLAPASWSSTLSLLVNTGPALLIHTVSAQHKAGQTELLQLGDGSALFASTGVVRRRAVHKPLKGRVALNAELFGELGLFRCIDLGQNYARV
jgi:hypothetical protein